LAPSSGGLIFQRKASPGYTQFGCSLDQGEGTLSGHKGALPRQAPGPLERMALRGGRATATFEDICDCAFSALFNADRYTKGKWKNKNSEYAQ
jgi:hypothetical protein